MSNWINAGGGIVALIVAGVMALASLPGQGYYSYDDTTYYYQGDDWYYYDTSSSSWEREDDPPQELLVTRAGMDARQIRH